MSLVTVARKDFEDAVRSRWLLGLSALFALVLSLGVYVLPDGASTSRLFSSLLVRDLFVTLLIPLIGVVIAYNSVVGERTTGSLKLLLSLPHSRPDVVLGKTVGRVGALAVPIVVAFLVPAVVALVTALSIAPGVYVGYVLFTVLLGAAFVAVAVGFSASVTSGWLAILGAIVVYLLSGPVWTAVQLPLRFYLLSRQFPSWVPLDTAGAFLLLRLLNPIEAFKLLTSEFVGGTLFAGAAGNYAVTTEAGALVMLFAWIVIPPLAGLWLFESADL